MVRGRKARNDKKKVSKYDKYKLNKIMEYIIDAIYMYDMQIYEHKNIYPRIYQIKQTGINQFLHRK